MESKRSFRPKEEFVALDRLWRTAENSIKVAEHLGGEPPIAPVNELRYSGRHLLDAALEVDDEARKAHLHKAERHACRAKYDSAEAHILYCARTITRFKNDYAKVQVVPVLPEWIEILQYTKAVQKRIRENRSDVEEPQLGKARAEDRETRRDADHELFVGYADQLSSYVAKLDVAREELNKSLEARRTSTRRWLIGLSVAIVTAIFSGIGIYAWDTYQEEQAKTGKVEETHEGDATRSPKPGGNRE